MEITFEGSKMVIAELSGHRIITDQPVKLGGDNSAPTPFELFLASIGTCAGIYVRLFCEQRKIDVSEIRLRQHVTFDKILGLPTDIDIEILVPADFPEKYISALVNAAELCKVKKTIANPPVFTIRTIKK